MFKENFMNLTSEFRKNGPPLPRPLFLSKPVHSQENKPSPRNRIPRPRDQIPTFNPKLTKLESKVSLPFQTFNLDYLANLILSQSYEKLEEELKELKCSNLWSKNQYLLWGFAYAIQDMKAMNIINQFDPKLSTICQTKLLAHRFGIESKGKVGDQSFDLTGLSDKITLRSIYSSLQSFLRKEKAKFELDSLFCNKLLSPIENVLNLSKETNISTKAETILRKYQNHETVVLPLLRLIDSSPHTMGLAIKDGYLIKMNKGLRNRLEPGYHIYRIPDQTKINKDFIEKLITKNIDLNYFETGINDELDLELKEKIVCKPQKSEICAWTFAKMAFKATLLLEKKDSGHSFEEIDHLVNPVYLAWKNNDQEVEVFKYLAKPHVNSQLLAQILYKTKNSNLYRGVKDVLDNQGFDWSSNGLSPLNLACENNRLNLAKEHLDQGYPINELKEKTPLIAAAKRGHTSMVNFLLDNGADVNQTDLSGRSPLCHTKIERLKNLDSQKLVLRLEETEKLLKGRGADSKSADSKYREFRKSFFKS